MYVRVIHRRTCCSLLSVASACPVVAACSLDLTLVSPLPFSNSLSSRLISIVDTRRPFLTERVDEGEHLELSSELGKYRTVFFSSASKHFRGRSCARVTSYAVQRPSNEPICPLFRRRTTVFVRWKESLFRRIDSHTSYPAWCDCLRSIGPRGNISGSKNVYSMCCNHTIALILRTPCIHGLRAQRSSLVKRGRHGPSPTFCRVDSAWSLLFFVPLLHGITSVFKQPVEENSYPKYYRQVLYGGKA